MKPTSPEPRQPTGKLLTLKELTRSVNDGGIGYSYSYLVGMFAAGAPRWGRYSTREDLLAWLYTNPAYRLKRKPGKCGIVKIS